MAMPPDDRSRRADPGGDDPDITRSVGPSGADRSDDPTLIGGTGSAGDEPTRVGGPAPPREPATAAMPATGAADRFPPRRPAGRPPQGGGGATWLWALGILVIVGVLAAIVLANQDDDDDVAADATTTAPVGEAPTEEGPTTTVEEETTTTTEEPEEETTTTTTAAPRQPGDAGTLETSDGRTLLPVPEDQDLSGFAASDVEGESVPVQSVVEGQGLWLGTDDENRVFALVTPETAVGDLNAGDRVHVTGVVEPNEEGSPDLGSDDGGELLARQGHHIVVSAIEVI